MNRGSRQDPFVYHRVLGRRASCGCESHAGSHPYRPRQSGKTSSPRDVPNHAYVSLEDPTSVRAPRRIRADFCPASRTSRSSSTKCNARPTCCRREGCRCRCPPAGSSDGLARNLLLMHNVPDARGEPLFCAFCRFPSRTARRPHVPADSIMAQGPAVGRQRFIVADDLGGLLSAHPRSEAASPILAGDYRRTLVERDLRDILRVPICGFDAFCAWLRPNGAGIEFERSCRRCASRSRRLARGCMHWRSRLVTVLRRTTRVFASACAGAHGCIPRYWTCVPSTGIQSADMLERHPLRGAYLRILRRGRADQGLRSSRREAPLFFWRDSTGHEVDILMDLGDPTCSH